ncbi:energy transducer TonB [Lutibacter sp.]|uniref:energy transducer TonB n=1 Tax=Lutibacter sp. TaxID=1925666 RepID=UPI00356968EF
MEIKKYPHAVLENYSKILIELGLVLALFVVYEFINIKSYPSEIKSLEGTFIKADEVETNIEIKPVEIQEPEAPKTVISERILKVDDAVEIKESIIESTELEVSDAVVVNVSKQLVAVEEEEETVVEDVPFMIIEDSPIYPGCTGTNKEKRDCFSNEVTKFVSKKFNIELAQELGLPAGSVQRIFVMFKIDKTGHISNIQARAPHKKLQEEAIRVIELLPVMTPGKQRGKPVSVSYGLPIVFKVE